MSSWQTSSNTVPMPQSTILGIHSDRLGTAYYHDGHAWITVTRNGITTHYGLWPDSNPRTKDNGPGNDIRIGLEAQRHPKASRYY